MEITNKLQPNLTVPSLKVVFTEDEILAASRAVEEILRSGRLTLGKYTERFEQLAAEKFGTKYAIGVSGGTAALEIILRALDVKDKQVIVPTNTNFATAAAAMYAGAEVVLADSNLYLDKANVFRLISNKTIAVITVHIGGYISEEVEEIQKLCAENNIFFLEDAAHAHGASISNVTAGALGYAAAFSLFPTKVITSGEGGIITTNSEELYLSARMLRDQGLDPKSHLHVKLGNSWRMSEIEAALGCIQLTSLDDNVQCRGMAIKYYEELLADSEHITMAMYGEDVHLSGYKCVAVLDSAVDRTKLVTRLNEVYGVKTGRGVYDVPLHQQPVFKGIFEHEYFPLADDFCQRHICLPLWRTIDRKEIEYVVAGIKSVIPDCL